jgi:hypothetical protein
VLRSEGQVAGHLLSIVGTFWSPFWPLRRQWWIWFLVDWADDRRETPFEDYSPDWPTVTEVEGGRFSWNVPDGTTLEFEVELLGATESAEIWRNLGVTPADF